MLYSNCRANWLYSNCRANCLVWAARAPHAVRSYIRISLKRVCADDTSRPSWAP
jgi:hypothetical protein